MFTPRTPVRDLWASYIDAISQERDWSEGYPEEWEYLEAARCEECGKIVCNVLGEQEHRELDDETDCLGYVNAEGPMMNYAYPIRLNRVGTEEAQTALIDLPLCIVQTEDAEYMALTGGGMDLSWEICEGYMRLGYLPPVHFSRLPELAGKGLNNRTKWVLAGMRASLLIQKERATRELAQLSRLRQSMK